MKRAFPNFRYFCCGLPLAALLAGCAGGAGYEFAHLYKDLPFEMQRVERPAIAPNSVSIVDFGGAGDAMTLNTQAFTQAFAALEEMGGGRLVVPEGVWLTGPIVLKSGCELHLERGALLSFTPDFTQYPIIEGYYEGKTMPRCQSPISAKGAKNIAITGYGVVDGSGDAWRPVKKGKMTASAWKNLVASGGVLNAQENVWYPSEGSLRGNEMEACCLPDAQDLPAWDPIKDYLRPVMVSLVECENVLLEGVAFQNSPNWNIHPAMCKNVIVKDITIRNPWYAQNGDGIDLESCTGVVMTGCVLDVGDDAICIKSGRDREGRERGIPTSQVIVDDCIVYHGHGGFVVGSEMSGGVKNIKVSRCAFLGTDVGLRFKSCRGRGGVVEGIWIEDIVMQDIPTEALLFDLFYGGISAVEELEKSGDGSAPDAEMMPVDEGTPQFRDIHISGVSCRNARRAMLFNGLPEMNVENVTVSDCSITSELGIEIFEATGVKINNVKVDNTRGPALRLHNAKNILVEKLNGGQPGVQTEVTGSRNAEICVNGQALLEK